MGLFFALLGYGLAVATGWISKAVWDDNMRARRAVDNQRAQLRASLSELHALPRVGDGFDGKPAAGDGAKERPSGSLRM